MKVLGIDTSTKVATIAVIDEEKVIGEYSLSKDMSHSEKLIPMVKEVLDNIELKIGDIDLFAVGLGPGSFTGLRIGVATVKSFAHLFDKPIVGVSTLEALAHNMYLNNSIIMPMLDARRDRVYTALYRFEDSKIEEIESSQILEIENIKEKLETYSSIIVNGEGSLVYREEIKKALGKKVKFASSGQNMPRGVSICELALEKYHEGKRDDLFTLTPDYIRPSQAERELKEKR
ncbi:tRNA (adenosine(37)-N6)-threonylcarbamoyltransferase complex dimerization subunit type 1 TsaB [Tissierella creatinophila]|uniref:tRNA threonylcarbamoyladenosine biosynthesis protein TsaB n=1 Tax=Tissierella creatinophila DSM 6911 TaxID=1123403 RepID=A0A1U7M835_TISCR|nr:tRNA (adenosine(37)-N6)-threonylcarbamoyltransferase complex dimerization subunit type 1 TsaB [Tissierella creatinophila]OLS03483.1 tRNA threonylcarbamoyladenosine biosynthesis protein TsaB [Tissierella creatinophila DSM 6911]